MAYIYIRYHRVYRVICAVSGGEAIFDQMDVDGNGTLQTEEVNRALTLLGIDRDLERRESLRSMALEALREPFL